MISIDCKGCTNHCCGKAPGITPILLREEEKAFEGQTDKVFGVHLLKKKPDTGTCIHLDDRTQSCSIYERRPLECKLYPYVLSFSGGVPFFKLDPRHCPSLKSLVITPGLVMKEILKHEYPRDWIASYDTIID